MTHNVNIPTVEYYNERYDRMPCNTGNKRAIFEILTDPENVLRVLIMTRETRSTPLSFYDRMLQAAVMEGRVSQLTNHEKQFVGTVTRVVMEGNGFEKSEQKQQFAKGLLKSGEIYKPVG